MVALRILAVALLVLLLWNPARIRELTTDDPRVLLDHSLSVSPAAVDSAWQRAADVSDILVFGESVEPFDTARPRMAASRLAPAVIHAAGMGGGAVLVTDGEIEDLGDVPPDLLRRAGVVLVPRDTVPSAALLDVEAQASVAAGDSVTATVLIGVWGDAVTGSATVRVDVEGRSVGRSTVTLPPAGGVRRATVAIATRGLAPGEHAVTFTLDAGEADEEPRDDVRVRVLEVSDRPVVVTLGFDPGWEARFLASTLTDILEGPTRVFMQTEPGRWRDGRSVESVTTAEVRAVTASAALVAWLGPAAPAASYRPDEGAVLLWESDAARDVSGDWYVETPRPSPLAGSLAGVTWDSLPPLIALLPMTPEDGDWVALEGRLLRRGAARPILVGTAGAARRELRVMASGFWAWALRGGATLEAYRTLVSTMVDWLLAGRGIERDPVSPIEPVVQRGHRIVFARRDSTVVSAEVAFRGDSGLHVDTLVFDRDGRAAVSLPPDRYRYAVTGGLGDGLVVVEAYSDEFRPRPVVLGPRPAASVAQTVQEALRDQGWLFVVVLALLVVEWAWRRRRGLP